MGKFKRFSMIVFVIASVLGVGTLAVLWFGWEPLIPTIAWLVSMPWFFVVEAVLLSITAVGLLVVFFRALTAPGRHTQLELKRGSGSIAITQSAIQSTVKHVVEAHQGLVINTIKVSITRKRSPRMSIHVRIDPGRNAELGSLGAKLQDEIAATLEAFTGYPVDSVRITFAGDADIVTPAFTQQATKYSADTNRQHQTQPVPTSALTAE